MTKIPWTNESWNPIRYLDGWHCTKCSTGCKNCYAERFNYRFGNGIPYHDLLNFEGFRLDQKVLEKPLHWRKPRRIFVCSMSDLFHEEVPFEYIDKIYAIMALCPQHTFQCLSKRPKRMLKYYSTNRRKQLFEILEKKYDEITGFYGIKYWPFHNLWLGTSISTQAEADKKIPILLQIPAAVRFVSLEPMLEEIYLPGPLLDHGFGYEFNQKPGKISWVIIGSESGPKHRPCKIEWIRDVIRHCEIGEIACFVKQVPINGKCNKNPDDWPEDLRVQEYPK